LKAKQAEVISHYSLFIRIEQEDNGIITRDAIRVAWRMSLSFSIEGGEA
jgi:hypothetical protein